MSTRSGRRLRAAIATIGGLALATTLLAAAPAAAASPTACRVKNLDTGVTKPTLQKAHNAAKAGQRLTVRGTCVGVTTLRKSLTITGISTATSGKPILDAKLNGTVVKVNPDVQVTLKALTIRNGATPGEGGGILNYSRTTLVLRDVIVRGNTASSGGGIHNMGTLTLNGSSSIRGNTAGDGAGVYSVWGTLTMNGSSSIRGNTAQATSGGVWNSASTLRMNGSSSIQGNTALAAGGVENGEDSTLVMRDSSSIKANTAANHAAGVMNSGLLRMRGSAIITLNVTPGPGGGVYNDGGAFDGVRCEGEPPENVYANMPDDCYWPDSME
jgi:hypothetical protein